MTKSKDIEDLRVNRKLKVPLYVKDFFPKLNEMTINAYVLLCISAASNAVSILNSFEKLWEELNHDIFDDEDDREYFEWGKEKFTRKYGDTKYQSLIFNVIYRDALRRFLRYYYQRERAIFSVSRETSSIDLLPAVKTIGIGDKIENATLVLLIKNSVEDDIKFSPAYALTNQSEDDSKELVLFAIECAREYILSLIGEEFCKNFAHAPDMRDAVAAAVLKVEIENL